MEKSESRPPPEPSTSPPSLGERVGALARVAGFDVAGVARAEPSAETERLREWIERGYAGEMDYIGRSVAKRVDPRLLLEGARSVVAVGFVYDPGSRSAGSRGTGEIARFAGGEDYHRVLVERVREFESGLAALAPHPIRTRGYVDTGPVLERAFAARAGLGWIGKNTCLIHPRLGSYLFLGAVVTDLEIEPDGPEPDHCGSCRACLDACPTAAFPEPYLLDSRRCIAYTTVEARGAIPEPLREPQGDRAFGCDLCQEVCPWNRRGRRPAPADPLGLRARLAPRRQWVRPALAWILELDEEDWRRATARTALRRAGRRGLLRNALVAAGNSGDADLIGPVERHAAGADPLLAEHARWALERLAATGAVEEASNEPRG
jgi:epoxyqueuosine reductase